MTVERIDNVGFVVEDLDAVIAFFVALGLELEGQAPVEGPSVDRLIALDGVRADVAMLRSPGGGTAVELSRFRTPAPVAVEPGNAPPNALGIRRVMFAVDDIEATVARLRGHGQLVGEVVRYEDSYRLCYVRGPEGILVALAERLS